VKVAAYINGHIHNMQVVGYRKTHYITAGNVVLFLSCPRLCFIPLCASSPSLPLVLHLLIALDAKACQDPVSPKLKMPQDALVKFRWPMEKLYNSPQCAVYDFACSLISISIASSPHLLSS